MKTIEVLKQKIDQIEERLQTLRNEHDVCAYAPREVEIQGLISRLNEEVLRLKRFLKLMENE